MGDLISGEQTVSDAIKIIKIYEGFSVKAYRCPAGKLTIGYGRTEGVKEGERTTPDKELDWLEKRVERDLIWLRNKLQPLILESNQEAALLCLIYNIGGGAFLKSGIFRQLRNSENNGKLPLKLIESSWLSWNKINGKVSNGLVNRRNAEWDLFSQHQ
jgi:lysozyme